MENEQEEVIIDSNENNEEIEIDLELDEQPEEVEVREERPAESLEARRARLKRQLEQVDKKLGINKPEARHEETTVTANGYELKPNDMFALMKNGITDDEDVDLAKRYAKLEGITIAEVLKDPFMKSRLAEKKEERTVAQATNTGAARRGSSKVSDDRLLQNARQGILPENPEDIARLYKARRNS